MEKAVAMVAASRERENLKLHSKEPPASDAESTDKSKFPAYDSMPSGSGATEPSSSSSSSADALKKVVKALALANPVGLPPEALKLLEEDAHEDVRSDLKKTQQLLNKKRKIHSKLLRLRESLETKHRQFQSYKDSMRDRLLAEQERYEEDVKEDTVQGLPSIENLLDVKTEPQAEAKIISLVDQLKTSRQEAALTKQMFNHQAQELQMYMQKVEHMQGAILSLQGGQAPEGAAAASPLGTSAVSPQMTKTPPGLRKRDVPNTQEQIAAKKLRQDLTDGSQVQVVEESPPKMNTNAMDWLVQCGAAPGYARSSMTTASLWMSWEDTQFEVTESTMTMEPQRIVSLRHKCRLAQVHCNVPIKIGCNLALPYLKLSVTTVHLAA